MGKESSIRRVVYTALMGDYEDLESAPLKASEGTDLVCFTDNSSLKSDDWKVELVRPRFPNDSIRSARYLKIMGPDLLADYDESLWLDNSVRLKSSPDLLFGRLSGAVEMSLPLHSFRRTVAAEFDAVAEAGHDDFSRVYEQMIHYAASCSDVLDERPYWTAIIARRHSERVKRAMQAWWEQVLRYSRRDQLSINYILAGSDIGLDAIDIDNHISDFHEWPIFRRRKIESKRSNSTYNALRSVPLSRIAKLQNENDELKAQLSRLRKRSLRSALREVWQRG